MRYRTSSCRRCWLTSDTPLDIQLELPRIAAPHCHVHSVPEVDAMRSNSGTREPTVCASSGRRGCRIEWQPHSCLCIISAIVWLVSIARRAAPVVAERVSDVVNSDFSDVWRVVSTCDSAGIRRLVSADAAASIQRLRPNTTATLVVRCGLRPRSRLQADTPSPLILTHTVLAVQTAAH